MKVINKHDDAGRLVYSSEIIRDIVDCALNEVEGVVKFTEGSKQHRSSIKIEQAGEDIFVDVYCKFKFNVEVSDVASAIQNNVKNSIENMTEFKVSAVNVHVIEVEFEDK